MAHCYRSLTLLLLLAVAVSAKLEYTPIGYTLTSGKASFSCWLVEGPPLGRVVAVKVNGADNEGEAFVTMKSAEIGLLKSYCQKAFEYKEPLKDGQKVIIGTIDAKTSRMDVVLVRGKGVTAIYLLAREKGNEPTFVLTAPGRENFYTLLDQAQAALR